MKPPQDNSEMLQRLENFHRDEGRESAREALLRGIEDPLRPRTQAGRFRPNPVMVLLAALFVLVIATFLIFNLVRL